MAHAERITFAEYRSRFATEADCREYLFQIRFPEGFVCPNQTHLSVQKLPETNLCDRWYSHAPHTSAADRLVLGDLPLCNR
mgnify:CR=1 FL=1